MMNTLPIMSPVVTPPILVQSNSIDSSRFEGAHKMVNFMDHELIIDEYANVSPNHLQPTPSLGYSSSDRGSKSSTAHPISTPDHYYQKHFKKRMKTVNGPDIASRTTSNDSSEVRDNHSLELSSDQPDFKICKLDHYQFAAEHPEHITNVDVISDGDVHTETSCISTLSAALFLKDEADDTTLRSGNSRSSVHLELKCMRHKDRDSKPMPSAPPSSPNFTPRWRSSGSGNVSTSNSNSVISSDPSLLSIASCITDTNTVSNTTSRRSDPSSISVLSEAIAPRVHHPHHQRNTKRRERYPERDDIRMERALYRQKIKGKGKKRKVHDRNTAINTRSDKKVPVRRVRSPHERVVLPMLKLQRTFSEESVITETMSSDARPPPYFVKRGPNPFLSASKEMDILSGSRTPSPRQYHFPTSPRATSRDTHKRPRTPLRRTKTNNPYCSDRMKSKMGQGTGSQIPHIRESQINSAPSPARERRKTPRERQRKMREIQCVGGNGGYHIVDSDQSMGSISYIDFMRMKFEWS